ncbi:hypothetical protein BN946_scf184571.g4 [Trametes cinnabarina]|uniref:Uncharacterized protein n=1 Tax=Pycnoporus cinnabarinus TaxID=5643 RepID=A0A060SVR5_PYCCI|nr:hypothetical protein BN946_scf184571.g4 [Trametes cinnabarina]
MYLAHGDASQDNYNDNRAAILELHPDDDIPSYDQIRRKVADLTGIHALQTAMCVNSCIAYTGPFADLRECPHCQEPRYDSASLDRGSPVPRRTFHTFPVGPQIQAMWLSSENARLMHHHGVRTQEILAAAQLNPSSLTTGTFDDIYKGLDYLREVEAGRIKDEDTVLMFSLDDLPPGSRYKKRYVLPGGVIGGPNKPKNVDSFLFPALHHLAALQREGLRIWDASTARELLIYPYLLLATADGPGMAYLSGLVGHQGGPSRPDDPEYNSSGSLHANVSPRAYAQVTSACVRPHYLRNLRTVIESRSGAAYQRNRLETGIAKPSIFAGLPRVLPLPACFGADLMHLITLNLTDLVISLLRGTITCDPTDDKATWDWAVLANRETWRAHGKLVEESTRSLPGSFDRPPRNPAEKISSGYKAWEFLLYVYGLLPAFLRGVQAFWYYQNLCKLVSGVRIVLQHTIMAGQLSQAFRHLLDFVEEYELLYYARRADRLHFVRQSVHATIHLATEVVRLGPGSLYTQWTLENYIGNITREIKQHVTPYANVSERALRRCQVNATIAMFPSLAPPETSSTVSLTDLGEGYALLHPKDRTPIALSDPPEDLALRTYLHAHSGVEIEAPVLRVTRWGRLQIPTGQIARTAWKEVAMEQRGKRPRRSRMVKLRDGRLAEVCYFFVGSALDNVFSLAMISLFSAPDQDILRDSLGVVCACSYEGTSSREVIDVKDIVAVVAMVPLPMTRDEEQAPHAADRYAKRFFLVEKPGLEIAYLSGSTESDEPDTADA